jgi:hypothetical protein
MANAPYDNENAIILRAGLIYKQLDIGGEIQFPWGWEKVGLAFTTRLSKEEIIYWMGEYKGVTDFFTPDVVQSGIDEANEEADRPNISPHISKKMLFTDLIDLAVLSEADYQIRNNIDHDGIFHLNANMMHAQRAARGEIQHANAVAPASPISDSGFLEFNPETNTIYGGGRKKKRKSKKRKARKSRKGRKSKTRRRRR